MSTVTDSLVQCPIDQGQLTDFFNTCQENVDSPFLDFIMSPANTKGVLARRVWPFQNKLRTVELIYEQPVPDSQIQDINDCTRTCVATTKRGNLAVQHTIDPCVKKRFEQLIEAEDLSGICEPNDQWFQRVITKGINAVTRAVLADVASKVPAIVAAGNYSTDAENADLDISGDILEVATKKTNGDPDPNWLLDINAAAKFTGYCQAYGLFGGTDLWQAAEILKVGCCQDSGIDLEEVLNRWGKVIAWDRWLAAVFGNDTSVMAQLGAMQLLYYARNDDGFPDIFKSNYSKQVIFHPRYGFPMDVTMSDNCGAISLIIEATTDLVGLPTDLFPEGHEMEGVNFTNLVQVVN